MLLFLFLVRQVLGDAALLLLATGCNSALLQLDLSSCCYVTDAGLLAALLRCPLLRDLTLSGCAQITDQVLLFFLFTPPASKAAFPLL